MCLWWINCILFFFVFLSHSESDTGMYTARASNGADASTCSAQLIVHESEYPNEKLKQLIQLCVKNGFKCMLRKLYFLYLETAEEKKSYAQQNTPYFAIRLRDAEIMENTFLRFMVKVIGEPSPKLQL